MTAPFVLHCGWCGRPMREACKCAERLAVLIDMGAVDAVVIEAVLAKDDAPPAEEEKAQTWCDRPPLL